MVCFLLHERDAIPQKPIAPRALRGRGVSGDNREIHTLGLAADELRLQCLLRARVLGKDDEPRRVAIDPVHDVRRPPA